MYKTLSTTISASFDLLVKYIGACGLPKDFFFTMMLDFAYRIHLDLWPSQHYSTNTSLMSLFSIVVERDCKHGDELNANLGAITRPWVHQRVTEREISRSHVQ